MPFSLDYQLTMEKTPTYFRTIEVPRRVYDMNPKVKLILIVRNPVTRTVSHYVHLLYDDKAKMPVRNYKRFEQHFENLLFDSAGNLKNISGNYYTKILLSDSIYYIHLKRWLEYFPFKQIHIVNGEEFIRNPINELKKLEKFLGLTSYFTEQNFIFDSNKGFYCLNNKQNKTECLVNN